MTNSEILEIITKTDKTISDIFFIKNARFERINIDVFMECFFSWIEINGERVHYEFIYNDKKNLVCIQKRHCKEIK